MEAKEKVELTYINKGAFFIEGLLKYAMQKSNLLEIRLTESHIRHKDGTVDGLRIRVCHDDQFLRYDNIQNLAWAVQNFIHKQSGFYEFEVAG